jgi:hypothetical protein
MNCDRERWLRSVVKPAIAIAFLAGMLFFTAVPRARAESEADCQRRVARADQLLHIAVQKNGPQSEDAQRRRQELHEARERCWNEHHKWWDEDQHRWHDQQDWDDHDHDRDHDH